ncbi:FAD/NAD(P)-binding domain-containing protein [Laetiporus sulphureus 93-53]|uniref:FAD/NAD(P)-binding domain-containing protein n=1 Tax=Laetiporus sulphureus 93-53 TaxID=1314785 RepID=A0A165BIX8_9APHY|nr:FAD/NAD(P)-binding domain-containing protein [Laetiporus sulphureus 93-53]KZT01144.1 FAD/NAD(P)-binding domain-containing protein [Laetiporus sulphureus 93-53]
MESDSQKRVAIIGGGQAGLVAYRHMSKYQNLKAVIFEASPSLGGIWSPDHPYHRPLMTTNICRHTCTFSDVPWPADAGRERKDLFRYSGDMGHFLHVYAQTYVNKADVKLNTKVATVDYQNDKWTVKSVSTHQDGSSVEHVEDFHYLIIATGFFSSPFIPTLPGIDNSPVLVEHSAVFKDPDAYLDKTVAVVGGSLSAVEIAGALSPYARKIHHIAPRPFYVSPLYTPTNSSAMPSFLPWDFLSYDRANLNGRRTEMINPTADVNHDKHNYLQSLFPNNLLPSFKVDTSTPPQVGISELYRGGIQTGIVQIYLARLAAIDTTTGDLVLSTEERIDCPDVVIMCTGYNIVLPYLSQSARDAISFQPNNRSVPFLSHRLVLHPDLPNAGFVGMYRGTYYGVIELQARYLAAVLSGIQSWPSKDEMKKGVALEESVREASSKSGIQFPHGDYAGLFESYADLLGIPMSDATYMVAANYPLEVTRGVEEIRLDTESAFTLMKSRTWVRGAVFRSWAGRWKVNRKVRGASEPRMNGQFVGFGTFLMRPVTASPSGPGVMTEAVIREYLYHEQGVFISATGGSAEEQRKAVYRYDPASDTIAVWSVVRDDYEQRSNEGQTDSWQHNVEAVSRDPLDESWSAEQHGSDGWYAIGRGSEAAVLAGYKFVFSGAEVTQFKVRDIFSGGLVSEATFTRP